MTLPRRALHATAGATARMISRIPSRALRRELVGHIYDSDLESVVEALAQRTHEPMTLADLEIEPGARGSLNFEDLMGLFPATPLTMGVTLMSPRQLGYLFRLARQCAARKAIEIGRYKGGGTVTLAAAMGLSGTVWSIDNGSVAMAGHTAADYDAELSALSARLRLDVRVVVGDSQVVQVETGEVDLVVIDADHSYNAVKTDFERWGRRVRVGGHVLLDDAFPSGKYLRHSAAVSAVASEVTGTGFDLWRRVDRMADLVRTR